MAKETNRARQCAELEVIKSIYGIEVEDLRVKNAGWKPLDVRISLAPLKGSTGAEVYVQTKLRIICSTKYPKAIPKVSLEDSKGLSDCQIKELMEELTMQAYKLKGEVMIFELAQIVQGFLHKHNKPPKGSFYDQMLQNQEELAQEKLTKKLQQQDKERQNILEEVEKRKELIKTEAKRREPRRSMSETSQRVRVTSDSDSSEHSSSKPHPCGNHIYPNKCFEHRKGEDLYLYKIGRHIRRGSCLGHSQNGCVAFSGIDVDSGKLLYITEWNIKYSQIESKCVSNCFWFDDLKCNGHKIDDFINSVEKYVTKLSQMHHKNVISYECVWCLKRKEGLIIYLVQDFVLGSNVFSIKNSIGWSTEGVRIIAKGVLDALIFLHNCGISHSQLYDTTVFVDNTAQVRCTDFSLVPHLLELITKERQKDGDLPALGILLESLMPALPYDMKNFVDKCKSDRTLSASELLDHPFLRKPLNLKNQSQNVFKIEINKTNFMENNAKKETELQSQNIGSLVPLYSNLTLNVSQSRLKTEFIILQYLGKGAFGDVLKVRNILDNREYAIKRIPLPVRSKQLYKKMTREVELLSRLNHENVVRYFNSWIENETSIELEEIDKIDHEENMGQDLKALSTYPSVDSEESSSSMWKGFVGNIEESDSDGIEFVNSDGEVMVYDDKELSEVESRRPINSPKPINQVMYIQMEFCEKSTLRQAIDDNLCEDTDRLWRLFREILEGLSHIHQQGIIHRDLKPVNIFLDLRDQIKIGDFGLATTSFLALQSNEYANSNSAVKDEGINTGTGKVGTTLYVAPELTGNASKSTYNQKVDMYTLGIILFEMSNPPFDTGMERIKTILSLRSKDVTLPCEMTEDARYEQNVKIIRWLLKHDPGQRPTAEELLLSDLMPPAQLEDSALQEMVKQILANPQSKGYKNLVARCLQQDSDHVLQLTYHLGLGSNNSVLEFVKAKVIHLFRKHGAIEMNTPLFAPSSKNLFANPNSVKLMTHSGSIVVLPTDLHTLFARHIAVSGINVMRRYSVDRTYREKKVFNFHPRQNYECAFDIITPDPGNFLTDAELISIAFEIACEIPRLKNKNLSIRMNHTNLLKSILLYCNVPKNLYPQLFVDYLNYIEGRLSKFQFTSAAAVILETSKTSATTLIDLLLIEFAIGGPRGYTDIAALKTLIKGKGEYTTLANNAISDLEAVVSLAQSLGVTCPIHICAGLPISYDRACGGIVWQMVANINPNRTTRPSVLAVGERYDTMLYEFQQQARLANVNIPIRGISGVGFSFSLDKLAASIGSECNEQFRTIDVVICVSGKKPPLKDVTCILRLLWSAGIRSGVVESPNFEDVEDLAKDLGAVHIILLGEKGVLKVKSWDREHFKEHHVTRTELVGYIQKLLINDNFNLIDTTCSHQVIDKSITNNSNSHSGIKNQDFINVNPNVEVNFLTQEKLSANIKKRIENQVSQQMHSTLIKFGRKEYFYVIVVDLSSTIINAIVGAINPRESFKLETAKEICYITERFPKHKRYIHLITDEVLDVMSEKKNTPIVALYSTIDSYFRIII